MPLEICIDSVESAINALEGGADRLEVCSSLSQGGLTPTIGLCSVIRRKYSSSKQYVMLRPRSGDFSYSEDEMQVILDDLKAHKEAGANGFVFGAVKNGIVDEKSCQLVIEAARPLPVTFHRAIDICADWKTSLETIISLGFSALLTSGQKSTAIAGISTIEEMIVMSAGRIVIMAGAGVTGSNVIDLLRTGCVWVHASASKVKETKANKISMGTSDNELQRVTCVDEVRALKIFT